MRGAGELRQTVVATGWPLGAPVFEEQPSPQAYLAIWTKDWKRYSEVLKPTNVLSTYLCRVCPG